MNNFWTKYPELQKDLVKVRDNLAKNMKSGNKVMDTMLKELVDSSGKMLRPAFVILGGQFGEENKDKMYSLATVIEMLHMATLVHDDIIDDSPLRRGVQTTQAKYGKNYAVFMGDFLFTKCFSLLSQSTSMESMSNVSKVISKICLGEINQFSSMYSTNLSFKNYLKRIGGKTAALFALSLYVGASESGCDDKLSKTLAKVGGNIGMAFQIIDDLLDYEGSEKVVGKALGNDIKLGIYNLPIIFAFRKNQKKISSLISKDFYSDEEVKEIISLCRDMGTIEETRALAKRYTDRAFKDIASLPDCESKEIIFNIAEKLLLRNY
jgi:heptaprenyl diphosphate synthase